MNRLERHLQMSLLLHFVSLLSWEKSLYPLAELCEESEHWPSQVISRSKSYCSSIVSWIDSFSNFYFARLIAPFHWRVPRPSLSNNDESIWSSAEFLYMSDIAFFMFILSEQCSFFNAVEDALRAAVLFVVRGSSENFRPINCHPMWIATLGRNDNDAWMFGNVLISFNFVRVSAWACVCVNFFKLFVFWCRNIVHSLYVYVCSRLILQRLSLVFFFRSAASVFVCPTV